MISTSGATYTFSIKQIKTALSLRNKHLFRLVKKESVRLVLLIIKQISKNRFLICQAISLARFCKYTFSFGKCNALLRILFLQKYFYFFLYCIKLHEFMKIHSIYTINIPFFLVYFYFTSIRKLPNLLLHIPKSTDKFSNHQCSFANQHCSFTN